jgi:hypothetical protein
MRDLHNNIKAVRAISPGAAVTDNTPLVSQIIDRLGYESLDLLILTGSLADADAAFTVLVEDGNTATLTDNAAVTDADLISTEAAASPSYSDDDKVFKIGYRGSKRYVRLTVTPANNTGNAFVAAAALLGHAVQEPVA